MEAIEMPDRHALRCLEAVPVRDGLAYVCPHGRRALWATLWFGLPAAERHDAEVERVMARRAESGR